MAKASGKFNCAQAVACTYSDFTGVEADALAAAAAAFGTGMGCLEGTCGAIVGAGLVLGFHHHGDRAKAMQAQRRVLTAFHERNGATVCKLLKGVGSGKPLRQCNDCVADAAEFLEAELG